MDKLEAIRKRPGMYIGSTGVSGLLHIVWELLSNSVDQVLAGNASSIEVVLHQDGSIEVGDNGRGLDLTDPKVLTNFTEPHFGPTADGHTPHIHIAAEGVGLAVANALSYRLVVTSNHQGKARQCEWARAVSSDVEETSGMESTGTKIRLWPDPTIFKTTTFPIAEIARTLYELEALLPQLEISFTAKKKSEDWKDGLKALLFSQNLNMSEPIIFARTSLDDGPRAPVELAIACSRSKWRSETIVSYCNFRKVAEKCKFVSQVRSSFWELLDPNHDTSKDAEPIKGLTLVANLTMLSPEYSGPTRRQINDSRAVAAAKKLISNQIAANLQEKTDSNGSPLLHTWREISLND